MKVPFLPKKNSNALVAGIAVAAAALLVVFVLLVRSEALELVGSQMRSQAHDVGVALRDKLEADLRRAPPLDTPNLWARLDPDIEDHYEGIPNLLGIAVRDRSGRVVAVIGSPVAVNDPVPPGDIGSEVGVALHPREGQQVPATVWFRLPRSGDEPDAVVAVAHLSFDDGSALWDGFNGFVIFAACVLALLVYALAVTAYLVRESGLETEARSRERFVRLRAIGEVAAGLAHEIRNPLNAIHLSVQVIERALKRGETDPRERDFARIAKEVGKIRTVADSFVRFTRVGDLAIDTFDFGFLVGERAEAAGADHADGRVTVRAPDPVRVDIEGDREKLGEAVSALLTHAAERAESAGGGVVTLRFDASDDAVALAVCDAAPSPDAVSLKQLLDPIAASRGDGAGLALAMVRTVVECHGGTFSATPGADAGLNLRIVLPRRFSGGGRTARFPA